MTSTVATERERLAAADEGRAAWRAWGPYVSERAWGTVREDYSAEGDAWGYLPHEHARSRAYRWSETASPPSATRDRPSASGWPCGTGSTRSSRSARSG